jgi:hypothetical protein
MKLSNVDTVSICSDDILILRLSRTGSVGLVAKSRSHGLDDTWTILERDFAMPFLRTANVNRKTQIGPVMLVENGILESAIISAVVRRLVLWPLAGLTAHWPCSHLASCPGPDLTPGARSKTSLACAPTKLRSPLDRFGNALSRFHSNLRLPSSSSSQLFFASKGTFFGLSGQSLPPHSLSLCPSSLLFLLLHLFTYTLYSTKTLAQPTSLHPFPFQVLCSTTTCPKDSHSARKISRKACQNHIHTFEISASSSQMFPASLPT